MMRRIFTNHQIIKTKLRQAVAFFIALLLANSSIAQITLRGTAQTANITSGSTLTINKPTGVVAGDIMFLIVSKYNVSTTPSLAGWSTVTATTTIGAIVGNDYASLLYRVADASDASVTSYSFAVGANTSCAGSIIAFSGVDVTGGVTASGSAGGPFDVQPGSISSTQSSASSQTITSITTAHANAAVIMFGMEAFLSASTFTAWSTTSPGALTEVNDFQGNPYNGVGAAWATKATAGSTGTSSLTISSSNYAGGILIALKPISCVPPVAPSVTSPVNYCLNSTASPLSATGSNLLWYTVPSGGTGSSTAPTPSTSSIGTTSYYVSQTIGCESARAQINVVVGSLPTASVTGQSNLTCYLSGNGSITVSASGGSGNGYMYSINNGTTYLSNGGLFNGLSAGSYKIRVKDGNGCESKSVQ